MIHMTDLIVKKRDGGRLETAEICEMVEGYTRGEIPDYQMSAMLMAMYFRGLDHEETVALTDAMMHSGETVDLSNISGIKADKHSTGGVGDKTSLVLCPMMAACGVKMAKMSGRGLGHTGGTLDKLESIPGVSTEMSVEKFFENVEKIGFCIASQTADVDPADKKLYALRDVTGTVAVQGLIVSSIMSKKLAAGADIIVLDVKCGSGGFMKTKEEALSLAEEMVEVGKASGRKTAAIITNMDEPLGHAVGNALEVKEAVEPLKGDYRGDLLELCLLLGTHILCLSGLADSDEAARAMLEKTIDDGSALEKLAQYVAAQGGDAQAIYDPARLPAAPVTLEVPSTDSGYVNHIDAEGIGLVSLHLGGGRETKESRIDPAVGVVLKKKVGEAVTAGDSLAEIHAADLEAAQAAAEELLACYTVSAVKADQMPFLLGTVR